MGFEWTEDLDWYKHEFKEKNGVLDKRKIIKKQNKKKKNFLPT